LLIDDTVAQSVLFPDLLDRPVVAAFTEPHSSSDGGAVLLKAADRRLGLLDRLSAVLTDRRDATRVQHQVRDLLAQRVYGLACGHADANDADALADDPIHKLLLDRDPIDGHRLASQPTLSRFEHTATPRVLYRLGEALADVVLAHHQRRRRGRARRITIDLDLTEDATHGAQQLALFNGFYGGWCYLPLVAFLTFDDEPRQYLVAALLRPGTAPASIGAPGLLRRLIPKLWQAFPRATLRVRLDGGFACPEIFSTLEDAGVEYVVATAKNRVLLAAAQPSLAQARVLAAVHDASAQVFAETRYQANTWPQPRQSAFRRDQSATPARGRLRRDLCGTRR
jgi:hypothetical protein